MIQILGIIIHVFCSKLKSYFESIFLDEFCKDTEEAKLCTTLENVNRDLNFVKHGVELGPQQIQQIEFN